MDSQALVYDYSGINNRLEEIESERQRYRFEDAPTKTPTNAPALKAWFAPHPAKRSWTEILNHRTDLSCDKGVGTNSIFFAAGKNTIVGQDDVLDRLVRVIKLAADAIVEIHAHTDERGDHFANIQLAAERGLMVRHALMARGVEGQRIEVTSHGPDRPQVRVSPGTTDENRLLADRLNRRVEVRLTTRGPRGRN